MDEPCNKNAQINYCRLINSLYIKDSVCQKGCTPVQKWTEMENVFGFCK